MEYLQGIYRISHVGTGSMCDFTIECPQLAQRSKAGSLYTSACRALHCADPSPSVRWKGTACVSYLMYVVRVLVLWHNCAREIPST